MTFPTTRLILELGLKIAYEYLIERLDQRAEQTRSQTAQIRGNRIDRHVGGCLEKKIVRKTKF